MPTSTSPRSHTTTTPSNWVSFSPYGDETTTATAEEKRKPTSRSIAPSSKDSWPLDEVMNDIEKQMDDQSDAISCMSRQMEDIEVVLSDARARSPSSKILSSRSKCSVVLPKKSSYVCMEDDDDDETYDNKIHGRDCNNDELSPRRPSIRRVSQRTSESNREKDDGRFPVHLPERKAASAAKSQGFVPPSHIQNPIYSRNKARLSSSSLSSQDLFFRQGISAAQLKLPTLTDDRSGALSNLSHGHTKGHRSSLTWDESVSSQRSDPSNHVPALESTNVPGKSSMFFGSRKFKCFLVFLATILAVSIGIVVVLWARQSNSESRPQTSPVQEAPQPADAPVIVPTETNDIATKTPEGDISEDYRNKETIVEEDIENSNPGSSSSERLDEIAIDNGIIQSPQDDISVQGPTMEPTFRSIDTDLVSIEQNSDTSQIGYDYTANTDFLVGVYYYPWHGERFHNGDGYMRKDLIPRHVPTLGEYNDSDPNVIAHHMKWFRQANIGLLVTSWWGPNRLEDSNTKDVIMEHEDVGNLKIALHYETTSRLGDGREKIPNAKTDIKYMCENYFDHPNYYKIDGRPVLFIYISRKLEFVGTLEEALLTMRSTASKCGHNLYLIGDTVFESAPDPNIPHVPFWYFDAVTNYDVYGSSGRPEGHVGTGSVDNYYREQKEWKEQALRDECRYIPAVSPGYNDRGVRMEKDHPALSRRITSTAQEGSLFHYQLKQAKQLVDWKVDNMILVNSFNEWHEDTQIEPVVGNPSTQPFNFTKGLEYVGYGELYLDILGAATSRDITQHIKYDYLF